MWKLRITSTSHPTFISLFNLRTPFSLTELSFLDITLHITNENISISIQKKDPDTHTYLHHSSSYPRHCKKDLPHSQLLRLHRLCSDDSNSLEKGTEMIFFFNNVATQCNVIFMPSDVDCIGRIDRTEVLNNRSPSNNGLNRISTTSQMEESRESCCAILPSWRAVRTLEHFFHNHRWFPVAATEASKTSWCTLLIPDNLVVGAVVRFVNLRCHFCDTNFFLLNFSKEKRKTASIHLVSNPEPLFS